VPPGGGVSGSAGRRAAVRYLLESPSLRARCRPLLAGDGSEWAALLAETETMSTGEQLLVHAAHDLWLGEGAVALSALARGLDGTNFERVVTALRLYRGEALPVAA
jgi:hypothetical protein